MSPRRRMGPTLAAATLTGIFCAAFAIAMHFIAPLVAFVPVALVSFVSGFLGSLFARSVLARKAAGREADGEAGAPEM